MVERAPQKKQDEQYPLLKVDSGGGDGGVHPQPTPTLVTPGWGVTCTPKQSWLVRWPEYISACWMTLILLGISFLVFYTLGMEAYRRQPVLLIKCNESKPASDVFYHQIIPRESHAFLLLYIEYLSYMAYKYPSLHFHVYFLIDDSNQSGYRVPRHPRLINSLIPISLSNSYPVYKLDACSKREIAEFQKKHYNINVTIMPLSKYMAMTPLKYKWRNIPLPYLSFYARVLSVWQYGGVGMDLSTFNDHFNNRQFVDRRISAILKQHNDGIKPEEYTNALNKIAREENEIFSMFYGLIHSIFNETRSFFTKSFPLPQIIPEKDSTSKNEPLIRIHRNKRESPTVTSDIKSTENAPVIVEIVNSTDAADLKKNEYQTLSSTDVNNTNSTKGAPKNDSSNIENIINLGKINKTEARSETLNKTDLPQLILFYDFTGFSDGIDSSFVALRSDIGQAGSENKQTKNDNSGAYFLSLDAEGVFIAASSKFHPLLGRLISAGCQRMHPKFAIQDTIMTQCSGLYKESAFCDNIYLL